MAENLVIEGLRVAAPVIASNHKPILAKIKSSYRKIATKFGPINASIYVTMFADFKADYPLETINEYVCQILKKYQDGDNDCTFNYNKTTFTIIRQFNYADSFYFENEILENTIEEENESEIFVPLVNGISIYCFPEGEDTKTQLSDGYDLTEFLKREMLRKYDVKDMRSFVYVECASPDDFEKIVDPLEKKQKEWNIGKNLSHKENEIKIQLDNLITRTLGEIL